MKGVGPARADILKKEAGIFTYDDLLHYFPFRHIDRTRVTTIRELNHSIDYALISARIITVEILGVKRARRLVATVTDSTGIMELVWFQGIYFVEKILHPGDLFQIFGKVTFFM
ncbi:MAG TPA: ATP-dependent DNA helicase RecG, partial [Ginsengibacter sp.]|nr:ATP-dependent DNA helicase RecG [Ginsengibacter sp.]